MGVPRDGSFGAAVKVIEVRPIKSTIPVWNRASTADGKLSNVSVVAGTAAGWIVTASVCGVALL